MTKNKILSSGLVKSNFSIREILYSSPIYDCVMYNILYDDRDEQVQWYQYFQSQSKIFRSCSFRKLLSTSYKELSNI